MSEPTQKPPVVNIPTEPGIKLPDKKKPHKALWIMLVILLLAVGGYLIWKYVYNNKSTPTQTTATEVKKDIESISHSGFGGTYNLFYPNDTAVSDLTGVSFNQQIFEGLVQYRNITDIKPELATSWTNPDSTTWLFNLKPDVKFHDGNIMTADDVKYSLDSIKKVDGFGLYTDTLKSVEVVSPGQVKIVTTHPDVLFLSKLTYLSIIDSKAPKTASATDKATGPYNVKAGTTPTVDKLELAAFDSYHDGHVYTRNLVLFNDNNIEDPEKAELAAIDNINTGKSDISSFLQYDSSIAKAEADNLIKIPTADATVGYVGLNSQKNGSPLAKKAVREALYTAIDIPAYMAAIKLVNADPATQSITKEIPGYDTSLTHPAGDATKAKQILATAGYPNGVTIAFSVPSPLADAGEAIAKQLKPAGITINIVPVDDFDKFFTDLDEGNMEMWIASYTPNILDGSDTFKTLLQGANYKNVEIDALIKKSDETLNTEDRLKTLQEISRKSMEDFAIIPTTVGKNFAVSKKKYEMTQDVINGELGVYFWKVYQK